MAAINRTDLDALEAAPDLTAFDDLGAVLSGMRYVVRKVNNAPTITITSDPYEFIPYLINRLRGAEAGIYALVEIVENRPPEEEEPV